LESLILTLDTITHEELSHIGGKAAQLWKLQAAGFPVPPSFCLTTTAFHRALALHRERISRHLSGSDLTDADTAHAVSDEIMTILANWELPAIVIEALDAALPTLEKSFPLAVRSSATAEDRADVSFAGQYETVLGVRDRNALLAAILVCWRSFFSPHALVARATARALGDDEAIALLLQQMVEAECSGVAFSVDPVCPDSRQMVVNAAWGLGTGVVDSQAATDTYRVRRSDLHREERQIREKPEQVVLSPVGGLALEPVLEDRRRAACLPDDWLRRIAQFTVAAENRLGGPQDVEWAIAKDRVWMLQSRPVTGLPPDFSLGSPFPLADEDRFGPLWEISGSSRQRVPLPLDLDVEAIRTAASTETLLQNGGSWGGRRDLTLRKIVNGRVYTRSVPSDLHPGDARIRRNASRDLGHRLRETGVTPWEHHAPEVMAATKRLAEFDRSTDDGSALANHLEDAFGAYRRHWVIHFSMPNGQAFSEPFIEAFATLTGRKKEEAEEAAFPLPELIFPMITPYLHEGIDAPEALRTRMNEERDRQAEALVQASEDEEAARVFRRWLPLMRRARTDLENHNHYIDQMSVGQLRAAILAAGRWLEERNLLAEREDVFWLHHEEITRALRTDPPASLLQTVTQRRIQWEEWEQMAPPPLFGLPKGGVQPRPPFEEEMTLETVSEDGVLQGTGASAGRVRGRARVIPSGTQQPDIAPDEILIAEHAGPAWTPLFPMLGGIVLTRAALFHHAATTAREYGLPAVINVRDATSRIPDGTWITLDGTTGEIRLEAEAGEGDIPRSGV
jgi:phosphohistidine swiveling domain-containing protein